MVQELSPCSSSDDEESRARMLKSSRGKIEARNYPQQTCTTVGTGQITISEHSPIVAQMFEGKSLVGDVDEELVEIQEPTSEEENGGKREEYHSQPNHSRNDGQEIPREGRLQRQAMNSEKDMKKRCDGSGPSRKRQARRSRPKKNKKQHAGKPMGRTLHS